MSRPVISVQIYPTVSELLEHLAPAVVQQSNTAVEQHGGFVLALAGGSTPESFYRLLAEGEWCHKFPWDKTWFFWGDERCVGPEDPDSNYRMAMETMLGAMKVPQERIIRMTGESPDPASAAADYEKKIREVTASRQGRFDLILLGMGEDGHTASLFPDTDALEEQDRWVVANAVKRMETTRLTFTYPLINRAGSVYLLVNGERKAAVMKKVFQPGANFPINRIRPLDGQLTWWVDRSAAARLSKAEIDGYTRWYEDAGVEQTGVD